MNDSILFLLILLIFMGGGFVQRSSGFGLGIFVMLFLPYIAPSQTAAAAISGLVSCGISAYNTVKYRKDLQFRLALPILAAAAFAIPLAVCFSSAVPERILKCLLGVVLIIFSIYFLFFSERIRMRPTVKNGVIAGALGGALGGMFSTGGPPVVLYLINAASHKAVYFATVQMYFCLTNTYSTVFRAFNGIITLNVILSAVIGLFGAFVGDRVGALVFEKLDEAKLKRIIYVGMIVSGVLMFF